MNRATIRGNPPRFFYQVIIRDPAGRIVAQRIARNLVTRVGVVQIFNALFKNGGTAPWYVSLIAGATVPVFATTDTIASHPGWAEIPSSAVSLPTRSIWVPGTITSATDTVSLDNSASVASYNILTAQTLQGLFLIDNPTIGGGSGNLYGEAAFEAPVAVTPGFNVTITAQGQLTAG